MIVMKVFKDDLLLMKISKDDLLLMKDFGRGPAVLRTYFEDDLLCNEGIWQMTCL